MKKILSFILILAVLALSLCACSGDPTETPTGEPGVHHVVMKLAGYGDVTIELYEDIAPITVAHFLDLVRSGYYDGTKISRVQVGFVIQGGQGAGTNTIKGEFAANGVENSLSHTKGVISMARSTASDSASDQFFISIDDACAQSCDGGYAAFGKVIKGMDRIDKLVEDAMAQPDYAYYYYYNMGFLPESGQIKITSIKVVD